jgi:hypothetical protein
MPSSRLQPALLGGLFLGVLSALPLIEAGNCCCCAWIIGGGLIAAYLTQNESPTAITVGDGALAGLMAGIIGTVISTIIAVPVRLLFGPLRNRLAERIAENARDIPDSLRVVMQPQAGGNFIVSIVLGFFFMLVLSLIFATVGGMIGAAIFSRSKPQVIEAPPPPPPL